MGSQYTFYDYVNSHGENVIHLWLNNIGGRGKNNRKAKARFTVMLNYLEGTHPSNWQRPRVDSLRDECSGLYEIRALINNVQYRLIGFHGPGRSTGTLVFGATEVGGRFEPIDTCRRAQERRVLVTNNPALYRKVHDYS